MLHSNVDHNIEQLHHYSQRLCDEMNADPDTALQTVLTLQAEAYEDIEPDCPIASPDEIFLYVEHQVCGRVEALINRDHARSYEQAFADEIDNSWAPQDEHNEFFSGTYEQAEQELLEKRKEMIHDLGFLHEDDMVAQDKRAGDFLPDEAYFTDEELLGDTWDEFFDDQLPF